MLKIYNSLTRKIEDFKPVDEKQVKIYTCGPTVYHFAHIGNLRSYIMEDILVKALKYDGYNVKRVMNITDVGHLSNDNDSGEDKMLKGAEREHKTVQEIAKFYTDAFLNDMQALNLEKPDVIDNATNCIDEYIKVISSLLEKGFAYRAGGNVYFDTTKLSEYHKFFNFKQEDLQVGVRDDVTKDEEKKNPNDFALWFTKSKFENQALKWDSPWGVGYPGWHIECSCISMKYLGEYIDIHCGGIDNAFPHHTNEIAQSEAYLGHKWCNYWMHILHLITPAGKMSKSSGEFLTISKLKEKGYSPLEYKYFCLESHYRKQLMFSMDIFENSVNGYRKLIQRIQTIQNQGDVDKNVFNEYRQKFQNSLNDDLNTSNALSIIFEVLKDQTNGATKLAIIKDFDMVLGLDLIQEKQKDNIDDEIIELANQRLKAKQEKNYALADELRNKINTKGYNVLDTKDGFEIKKI